MKKNKFIDKCKSWLLTLGVASVFGLAALGVNAAKSYEKAYAYDYHDNGELQLNVSYSYDNELLYNYWSLYQEAIPLSFTFHIGDDDVLVTTSSLEILNESDSDYYQYYFYFENTDYYVLLSVSKSDFEYDDTSFEIEGISEAFLYDNAYYTLPSYEGYQSLRNYALSYNAPQQSGNFITALTSFMSLLGGAIVQLATPVASGVTSFASALFIDNSHLSIMGGIIGIFAGIALAVGITSKVYAWVSTLGN